MNRRNLTTGQLFYTIGSFDASGPGTITNGVMDSNGPGFAAATQSTFTGTYTVGSDGRGRMDIAIPVTGKPAFNQSFCFALDSFAVTVNPKPKPPTYGAAGHAFVIEDDTSNVTSSGEFMAQVVNPANSIMQGSWSFGMTGRAHYPTLLPNGPDPRFAFAGYVNFDGLGTITGGEMDEVISNAINGVLVTPTYKSQQSLAGTYSIPTPVDWTSDGPRHHVRHPRRGQSLRSSSSTPTAAPRPLPKASRTSPPAWSFLTPASPSAVPRPFTPRG